MERVDGLRDLLNGNGSPPEVQVDCSARGEEKKQALLRDGIIGRKMRGTKTEAGEHPTVWFGWEGACMEEADGRECGLRGSPGHTREGLEWQALFGIFSTGNSEKSQHSEEKWERIKDCN